MTDFTFRERLVLLPQAPFTREQRAHLREIQKNSNKTKNNVALLFEPAPRTLFFPLSSVVLLLLASRSRRGDVFDDSRAVQSRREQDKKSSDFKGEVRHRLRDALHERRGEIARGENRAGKVRSLFFLVRCSDLPFRFWCLSFVVVVVLLSFFFFRVLREIREMEFLNGGKGTALLRADRGTICFRTLADERPYLYSLRVFLPRRQKTGD